MKALKIQRGKQSGFTLIELVMVIVVLGILAAMAITKYTGVQTEAQNATASYSAKSSATGAEVKALLPTVTTTSL